MQDRWWANIGFEPNSRTYYLLFMHKWKVMQYYACSPESNQCSHLVELSKSVPCWQETAPSYIPSECKVDQRQSHLVFQQSQVVFFVSFSGWFQFMSILLYCTSCRSGQWILHSSSGVSRLQPSAGQPESKTIDSSKCCTSSALKRVQSEVVCQPSCCAKHRKTTGLCMWAATNTSIR